MASIPEAVKRAALFPPNDLPDPPPEHPFKQLRRDGYSIGWFGEHPFGTVLAEKIADVDSAVADVRDVLRRKGRRRAAWMIPEAAQPEGLAEKLRGLGMTTWDEPPFEPRIAGMALVTEPEAVPGIEARLAETFEEFDAANRVAFDAFGMTEEMRASFAAAQPRLWELEQRFPDYRTYVALLDGEVVAGAAITHGANAAFLAGGFTREDMRGRGVYRALVRARWDAAVDRGTPALTVGAGKMSRPILERLGFETVGWFDTLRDVF